MTSSTGSDLALKTNVVLYRDVSRQTVRAIRSCQHGSVHIIYLTIGFQRIAVISAASQWPWPTRVDPTTVRISPSFSATLEL